MLNHVMNNELHHKLLVHGVETEKKTVILGKQLDLICSDVIFLDRGPKDTTARLQSIPRNTKNEGALRDGQVFFREFGELGIIGYQSFTAVSFAK